jgi:hypothetical protein
VADPITAKAIRFLEATLLPGCAHFTAASPLIAQAYVDTYPLGRRPTVILNVFPKSEAPSHPPEPRPAGSAPLRLYWFSQTIGGGRGLEPLLDVLGRVAQPTSLHLRGVVAPGYAAVLRSRAAAAGFKGEIEFLPFGAPAEMARLASAYDVGLSLEASAPANRNICLTNKIFVYLLAGLPTLLTPTAAQSRLAADLGDAALLADLEHPATAAPHLEAWLRSPPRLAAARAASWKLGQERYNWDHERGLFLAAIETSFK